LKVDPSQKEDTFYGMLLDTIYGGLQGVKGDPSVNAPANDLAKGASKAVAGTVKDIFDKLKITPENSISNLFDKLKITPENSIMNLLEKLQSTEKDPSVNAPANDLEENVDKEPKRGIEDFDFGFGPQSSLDESVQPIAAALSIGEGADYGTAFDHSEATFFPNGITNMTLDEIFEVQEARGKGSYGQFVKDNNPKKKLSTPVGKYQFVGGTLKALVKKLGIKGSELFDEEMQDKLFMAKMKERGFEDFLKGDLSLNAFMKNMAAEWAGFNDSSSARKALKAALQQFDTEEV
jgi:hypothetical protein